MKVSLYFTDVNLFSKWYHKNYTNRKLSFNRWKSFMEESYLHDLMEIENKKRRDQRAQSNKKWRENNPEEFLKITKLAQASFMSSDYFHSDKHIENLKKAAKSSAKVNKEKGNIGGKDCNMAKYKIAKKAKERAEMLLSLPKEFTPQEAGKIFTTKQWHNIMQTDLVIKTEKRSGYHNRTPHYILNYTAIELAINTSTDPNDYF